MAKVGGYTIGNLYQGGYSSIDPNSGGMNQPLSAGDLAMTIDGRTANVLQEVSSKLNMGVRNIEVGSINPEVFDSIPNDQLREVNRLAKLTGTEMSMHAPVVEPSGVGQQGFDEEQRKTAERQMMMAAQRAHDLDPKGNIPVTFHASGSLPGTQWKVDDKGRMVFDEDKTRVAQQMIAVNRETGKMVPLKEEFKYYPGDEEHYKPWAKKIIKEIRALPEEQQQKEFEKLRQRGDITYIAPLEQGQLISANEHLDVLNNTEWDNSVSQLIFNKERADEILRNNNLPIMHVLQDIQEKRQRGVPDDKIEATLSPDEKVAYSHYRNAEIYLNDTETHVRGLFSKAYEFGTEKQRETLKKLSESYKKELSEKPREVVDVVAKRSRAVQNLLLGIKEVTPKMYESVEDFAVDKSSETFANVALNSFKHFGNTAPIISIENPPVGGALATGEDLKNLVEKSRERFVEKAIKSKSDGGLGLSTGEAKKQAEKLLGVTWDVGHINMMRRQGFGKEEIIKQSEQVAPLVKHVHLSDNFGLEHTELPMGMGNVPTQEIMEKLGKEGFKGKKVIEAFHWWQHFKSSPFKEVLQGVGSPIYSEGSGPVWNQAYGFQQDYYSGVGPIFPQYNFQTFGAGFSQLPTELGGQMPGAQGQRSGGPPMQ